MMVYLQNPDLVLNIVKQGVNRVIRVARRRHTSQCGKHSLNAVEP